MSCDHKNCCNKSDQLRQTLDELDFERGIWASAQCGDLERCQKLVKTGVDVNVEDNFGYTALHYSARHGKLDVCKWLLRENAKVDAKTRSGGATPLHRACTTGHLEVVRLLLTYKADPEIKDADGKTALHRAAENQHDKICELLINQSHNPMALKRHIDKKNKLAVDYAKNDILKDLLKM
ncbi:ankyrin repeat domain-containing protein 39 [Onthophagus taurus]|uniref:ankyrin repeat domain-containing protein 39 n=1 Tax=Onthophagus taurus TaxID=166361 RepID=UPI000C20A9B1|nr:ankyrin repeat domain-containing protein 39 [Onthophagus taurus]